MRIGKDEIGIFGGVGAILVMLGVFLAVYNLLTLGGMGLTIVGIALLFAGLIVYYADLFEHRRRRQQASA